MCFDIPSLSNALIKIKNQATRTYKLKILIEYCIICDSQSMKNGIIMEMLVGTYKTKVYRYEAT